jgi:putative peptide maturation dehydrogenase
MQIKRSEFVFYYHKNAPALDILSILKGEVNFPETEQLLAFPVLHGQEILVDFEDFNKLKEISTSKWMEVDTNGPFDREFIEKFSQKGVILADGLSDESQAFIKKENTLNSEKWNIYAAFFHFLTKWKNVDVQLNPEDYAGNDNIDLYHKSIDAVIDNYGAPPSHFHKVASTESVLLPIINKEGDGFFDVVMKRKTGRVFDRNRPLDMETLSTMLLYTWGCHGYYEMHPQLKMLHKTVPSGGSLHPTECYLLALHVEGLTPGIYHYNVEKHALDNIKKFTREEGENLANSFIAGQNYVRDANAIFIMTSRYFRNYWKYRQHTLAYKVTLFDAAHLSQMFYLNCAKMNLSCFVTGALNSQDIEREIGIDGFGEGATLVVGCGYKNTDSAASLLEPEFKAYNIER